MEDRRLKMAEISGRKSGIGSRRPEIGDRSWHPPPLKLWRAGIEDGRVKDYVSRGGFRVSDFGSGNGKLGPEFNHETHQIHKNCKSGHFLRRGGSSFSIKASVSCSRWSRSRVR